MIHQDPARNKLRDETLRRIGRNLVNFQRLELLLKTLIPGLSVAGAPHDLQAQQERRTRKLTTQSLGPVVQAFNEEIYGELKHKEAKGDEAVISFGMRLSSSKEEQHKKSLRSLVKERNRLIHHDLAEVDFSSAEECERLCKQLDEQNERIGIERTRLESIHERHMELRRMFLELMESEEFRAELFGPLTPAKTEDRADEL